MFFHGKSDKFGLCVIWYLVITVDFNYIEKKQGKASVSGIKSFKGNEKDCPVGKTYEVPGFCLKKKSPLIIVFGQ